MDRLVEWIFLLVFIVGVLISGTMLKGGAPFSLVRIIRASSPANSALSSFVASGPSYVSIGKKFLFKEERVISMAHRFTGRFDAAIIAMEQAPILEILIERKFPSDYLPAKPKEEDFFQLQLYALALMESGISCSSARLVLIYCRQDKAKRCTKRADLASCIVCNKARIFKTRFAQKVVLRELMKLEEMRYMNREPRPSPSRMKCRSCPYSKEKRCQYSAI